MQFTVYGVLDSMKSCVGKSIICMALPRNPSLYPHNPYSEIKSLVQMLAHGSEKQRLSSQNIKTSRSKPGCVDRSLKVNEA